MRHPFAGGRDWIGARPHDMAPHGLGPWACLARRSKLRQLEHVRDWHNKVSTEWIRPGTPIPSR